MSELTHTEFADFDFDLGSYMTKEDFNHVDKKCSIVAVVGNREIVLHTDLESKINTIIGIYNEICPEGYEIKKVDCVE